MTGDTQSGGEAAEQYWSDFRVVYFIAPLSALIFAGWAMLFAVTPYWTYFTEWGDGTSTSKKLGITGLSIFFFLCCLYMCVGFYQLFFIELREKFIARKVGYKDGVFTLRGWYFKQDSFKEAEVVSVEQFQADPRFLGNNILTMLTRNPKSRCNFNLKVSLKDGRVFYMPGELGRPEAMDRGDELKAFLEERARVSPRRMGEARVGQCNRYCAE